MRNLLIGFVMLLLSAGSAPAAIIICLPDDSDDDQLVRAVYTNKDVAQFRQKLDDLRQNMLRLKEKDFIALFGQFQPKPANNYAMPLAQSRVIGLSGMRYTDEKLNKDHTEFYIVKDVAALKVYYQIDGESPAAIIFHFPADKDFPKLTKDNLAKRLAWDEDKFKKFLAHYQQRMIEVFPWEIDQKELAKLHEGDFAIDAKTKLEAWIESGKRLGYKYDHKEGSNDWYWSRPDGKLARHAHRGANDGPPVHFFWFHEDGSRELRKETFGYQAGELTSRRWCRPKTYLNIRYETNGSWSWCDIDGNVIRVEWDDNGDGIPDWYTTKEDNIASSRGKEMEKQKRKPLKVEDSWAINPKLIPQESRISDQPDLRVPIRRKVGAEPVK